MILSPNRLCGSLLRSSLLLPLFLGSVNACLVCGPVRGIAHIGSSRTGSVRRVDVAVDTELTPGLSLGGLRHGSFP